MWSFFQHVHFLLAHNHAMLIIPRGQHLFDKASFNLIHNMLESIRARRAQRDGSASDLSDGSRPELLQHIALRGASWTLTTL